MNTARQHWSSSERLEPGCQTVVAPVSVAARRNPACSGVRNSTSVRPHHDTADPPYGHVHDGRSQPRPARGRDRVTDGRADPRRRRCGPEPAGACACRREAAAGGPACSPRMATSSGRGPGSSPDSDRIVASWTPRHRSPPLKRPRVAGYSVSVCKSTTVVCSRMSPSATTNVSTAFSIRAAVDVALQRLRSASSATTQAT